MLRKFTIPSPSQNQGSSSQLYKWIYVSLRRQKTVGALVLYFTCICLLLCDNLSSVRAFNVDTDHAVVHSGSSGSMFGFTVAQHIDEENNWLLVGAPEAQTRQANVIKGGAVYKCRVEVTGDCRIVPFDEEGNAQEWNGFAYVQTENKTKQWFGATLSTSGEFGAIVACAPRYVYFSRQGNRREPIGSCFVKSPKLDPQIKRYTPCKSVGWGYHRVGFCQSGFSAALSADESTVVMGAVGSFYWQGQVFSQDLEDYYEFYETLESQSSEEADNSYLGYSMATGEFTGDAIADYVAGVPRGEGLKGKIAVYNKELTSLHNISGEQIGEYFGYSLAVDDFNGDTLDDIAVGAPFYTDFDSNGYETGRVYVHYQTKKHKFRKERGYLVGSQRDGIRFGQALATLGDINNDNYKDLAVGSPYDGKDGKGAIYIFHGSKDGLITEMSQVVYASDLDPRLRAFGFSVSAGKDLDDNGYPDILVGAYESDKAVFLKSRPVIRIEPKLRVDPKFINLEQRNCELNDGTSVTCFSIVTCMKYDGLRVPGEITVSLEWKLDELRNLTQRAFYLSGSERETVHNESMRLYRGMNVCQNNVAYLKKGIRDKLTPIEVSLRYKLLSATVPPGALKPILDQYVSTSVSTQGHIKKNCGDDNVCIPDLSLFATSRVREYVMGTSEDIDMTLDIFNLEEDSFESQVRIDLPQGVDYRNIRNLDAKVPVECYSNKGELNQTFVLCDVGNPLPSRQLVRFTIKTRTNENQINTTLDMLRFKFYGNSSNPEDKMTLDNNLAIMDIPIVADVNIQLTGVSRPEQVLFNSSEVSTEMENEEDVGPEVLHLYEIRNWGPSSIETLSVLINWPSKINGGQDNFMYLPEMPRVIRGTGYCVAQNINPNNITVNGDSSRDIYEDLQNYLRLRAKRDLETVDLGSSRQKRLTEKKNLIKDVDCSDSMQRDCTVIRCHIGRMGREDRVLIAVRSRVWINSVIELQDQYRAIQAYSHAVAQVMDVPYPVRPKEYSVETTKIETFVAAIDAGPGTQPIELWVIILAIVGGCLLLFLLVILLWLCGFFRRQRAEEKEYLHKAEKVKSKNGLGLYESVPSEDL